MTAPFYVDTGASSISIPQALASKLGITIGPDTQRREVHTANGVIALVLGGLGIAIVSTSAGVISDRAAREKGIGGEVLCVVS